MNKGVFSKMHTRWFGTVIEDPNPEMTSEDEFEILTVDSLDGETEERFLEQEEEHITLSPEEYEELKKKGDTASALGNSVLQLKDVLNASSAPPAVSPQKNIQQKGETDEEFKKRIGKEIWKDDPISALEQVIDRRLGPLATQIGTVTSNQARDILFVKDETKKYASKYKKEIEQYHASLTPDQQNNPNSWQYSYNQVVQGKQQEIIMDEASSMVEGLLEKKLEELGISSADRDNPNKGKPVFTEGSSATRKPTNKKVTIKITPEEKRIAFQRGMSEEDYLLATGRITDDQYDKLTGRM